MSEKKRRNDVDLISLILGDDDIRPSRSVADALLLLKFMESREERLKQEIISALQNQTSDELKSKVIERMLKMLDKTEELMQSMTMVILSLTPSMKNKIKVET